MLHLYAALAEKKRRPLARQRSPFLKPRTLYSVIRSRRFTNSFKFTFETCDRTIRAFRLAALWPAAKLTRKKNRLAELRHIGE
jgi:hypothetical protein